MATEEEWEEAVDDLNEKIAEVADNISTWSQEESAEMYEAVADACQMRANSIRQEMGAAE